MASKRRLRRKSCTHKVQYTTRESACIAIARNKRAGIKDLHVYKCCFCPGWHLGHHTRIVREAIRRLE